MASYKIIKHYLTKNGCYKAGKKRTRTTGIVKHSTGADNPRLCRYIDDPANLGENRGNNHWNMPNVSKCVHFMIGLDKAGKIAIYQLLPLDYRCWGCGSGPKGCASNHGDCDHWLKKHGKDMDWARKQAGKAMDGPSAGDAGDKDKTPAKSGEAPKKAGTAAALKVDAAKRKDIKLAGTYTVNTRKDPLALRAGAGSDKPKIVGLAKGIRVECYGYYSEADGAKWLLVAAGGKTGFVHSGYMKKV